MQFNYYLVLIYYNDRRIIPAEYLFGDWDFEGSIFESESYLDPEKTPNACTNPNFMSSYTLGSTQEFHDYLYNEDIVGFLSDSDPNLASYLNSRGNRLYIEL